MTTIFQCDYGSVERTGPGTCRIVGNTYELCRAMAEELERLRKVQHECDICGEYHSLDTMHDMRGVEVCENCWKGKQ